MKMDELVEAPPPVEVEFSDEEDTMRSDIYEAVGLLSKCQRLMAFMGDIDLLKTITKRDRAIMSKLAGELHSFIDEVENSYVEGEA